MTAERTLQGYAWLSVGAAVATIVLKTLAWYVTGSVGLLSDALESLINLIAALLPEDTNQNRDVNVRNLESGTLPLASADAPGAGPTGTPASKACTPRRARPPSASYSHPIASPAALTTASCRRCTVQPP